MPDPNKPTPDSRLNALNDEFNDDLKQKPLGEAEGPDDEDDDEDADDDDASEADDESSEDESEGEDDDDSSESSDDDDSGDDDSEESEDDDEDDIEDLLLTDEERQAQKKGKKDTEEDDADDFLNDEEKLVLSELEGLTSDPKLGKIAKSLSVRYKNVAKREEEVVSVMREMGRDVHALGLTAADLNDPQWTQKLISRIREQTIRELQAGGGGQRQPTQQQQNNNADNNNADNNSQDIADDDILTGAEAKALVERVISTRLAGVQPLIEERESAAIRKHFSAAFEHHWNSNPLLRKLSENPKQGAKLRERAMASFGSTPQELKALLGPDGAGMRIRSNLNEFADLLRYGIRSSRSDSSDDGGGKSGRGPLPRKGGNAPSRKAIAVPKATTKVNGVVVKRSPDERLSQFSEAFSEENGYGG